MVTMRAANFRVLQCGIYSFGAISSARFIPWGVISKAQAMIESDRKTEDTDEHDESNDPIRNLEEWKNLRGDLDQKPGDNAVSNCDPVDVATLQLGQKGARVHFLPSQVKAILL